MLLVIKAKHELSTPILAPSMGNRMVVLCITAFVILQRISSRLAVFILV